jgi:hypothetical protein
MDGADYVPYTAETLYADEGDQLIFYTEPNGGGVCKGFYIVSHVDLGDAALICCGYRNVWDGEELVRQKNQMLIVETDTAIDFLNATLESTDSFWRRFEYLKSLVANME